MIRYRSADFCYLVLSAEIAHPFAPPHGWGLLVATGDTLELRCRPMRLESSAAHRLALLVSIARKNGGPRKPDPDA